MGSKEGRERSSRRAFLTSTAVVGFAGLAGRGASSAGLSRGTATSPTAKGTQDDGVTTFEFEGWTSGWRGQSPDEIGDEVNPTLTLNAGERYRFRWVNADGIQHNVAILDGDDNVLERTEIISTKGETQTLEFTATEEMATYLCQVHPTTMVGDVALEAAETTATPAQEFEPVHDVLVPPEELPQERQHNVEDLRELMVVIERDNQSVAIVDTTNHEFVARVDDVGNAIHVADFHPFLEEGTRDSAYVYTQSREGWMYKVDLFGFNRVARVRAGTSARDIATSRDGKYVAGGYYAPKRLHIADAETMEPLKTIDTSGKTKQGEEVSSQVHAVADVPEQGLWLIGLFEAGRVQLVDYTQEDFPIVADIQVADRVHDGFFGPNKRYFFLASQGEDVIGVVDTEERELATTIDTSSVPHPGPGAVDPNRNQAFTTHLGAAKVVVWDTQTFERKKVIDTPGKGLFIQYHPDSDYVWADVLFDSEETDSLVYQIDPETLEVAEVVDTAEWGEGRSLHPEFTLDGSQVYFSLWDANKLVVLDSNTAEHVATIDGFVTPTGKFLGAGAEEHAWSKRGSI